MFVQPGSSITRSNLELPVGSFQSTLWSEVHYDEDGFNRGYPVEVTMWLGQGEELRELVGQDDRDSGPEALATNTFRAAMLATPIEQLGDLQADAKRLRYQRKEAGDILFHMGVGLYAHGIRLEEVVAAQANAVAPMDHTPVLTFGDFDELVHKNRNQPSIVLPGFNTYVDLEMDSLSVVTEAGSQYMQAYERLLKSPPSADAPYDRTRPVSPLGLYDPVHREEMVFTAGSLLWCLSWVAQFRLQTSLQEIAHDSIEKAIRRKAAGIEVLFGRGDER